MVGEPDFTQARLYCARGVLRRFAGGMPTERCVHVIIRWRNHACIRNHSPQERKQHLRPFDPTARCAVNHAPPGKASWERLGWEFVRRSKPCCDLTRLALDPKLNLGMDASPRPPVASNRVRMVVHILAAGSLLLLAGLATWKPLWVPFLDSLREAIVAGALLALLTGLIRRPRWLAQLSARLCLIVLSSLAALALTEVALRSLHFDFRQQQAWIERTPPGFRRPLVPTGTVFFRHEGHVIWTGQPQKTQLQLLGLDASAYADEPVITLRYDEFGFRNEPRPDQWAIAVAGDSFTELGDVAFADLFTTRMSRTLQQPVLNLGVADTGPLAHLSYLQTYGLSPTTRDLVIVFFEGNDLRDITTERAAELHFERTGLRSTRPVRPQTSFLQAVGEWLTQRPTRIEPGQPRIDALFVAGGRKVPVTLDSPPWASTDLTPAMIEALNSFFTRYAAFGRQQAARTWLAYMPSKIRVLHGSLEFGAEAAPALAEWSPSDLPGYVARGCTEQGIRFIDLTPDLIRHTRVNGELVFNHLHDCHLNARGSHVVAETLSSALRDPLLSPTP